MLRYGVEMRDEAIGHLEKVATLRAEMPEGGGSRAQGAWQRAGSVVGSLGDPRQGIGLSPLQNGGNLEAAGRTA